MEATLEIVRAVKTVRPLPDVAHRVLDIVQTADFSIDELISVVRTEPTLVARVLRLCNSARTGLDTPITSIGDAITYLGSRNLVQLVLVTCSAGMFAGMPGSLYADPTTLWQHSIGCAFASQAIAVRTGEATATTAFTVGILHDVGRIALGRVTNEERLVQTVVASATLVNTDHLALERRAFGFDHATVAGFVADEWRLPPTLGEALRGHHQLDVIAGENPLPAVLHVADQLVLQSGIGNAFPRVPVVVSPAATTRLGLRAHDLEALAATLTTELAKASELLNLAASAGR
jgi:HD-like signal output (HDOD) protein